MKTKAILLTTLTMLGILTMMTLYPLIIAGLVICFLGTMICWSVIITVWSVCKWILEELEGTRTK